MLAFSPLIVAEVEVLSPRPQAVRLMLLDPVRRVRRVRSPLVVAHVVVRDRPGGRRPTRVQLARIGPPRSPTARWAPPAGYSALVTGEHADLAHIVRTEGPHLVLLDLKLPGTDGIELMRSVPELADLPVVFISAYGRDETIAEALKAGAADYIVKPFTPTELTARVGAALRKRAAPEPFSLAARSPSTTRSAG